MKLAPTVHLDMVYWCHMVVCVLDLHFTLQWPRHKMAIAGPLWHGCSQTSDFSQVSIVIPGIKVRKVRKKGNYNRNLRKISCLRTPVLCDGSHHNSLVILLEKHVTVLVSHMDAKTFTLAITYKPEETSLQYYMYQNVSCNTKFWAL